MEIIIVVLTVALLSGIKICTVPDNKEYLSRSYTLCCKGILSLLIMFCHIQFNRVYLEPFKIFNYAGNFIVSIFFFYSGYGVMFSYMSKGIEYKKFFFKKRILKILYIYIIFNILYIITDLLLKISISNILLNKDLIVSHSWYIVDIIILYLGYWMSIKISNNNNVIFLLNLLFGFFIMKVFNCANMDSYWYITILNFSMGTLYAIIKEKMDMINLKSINKNIILPAIKGIITVLVYLALLMVWIKNINYAIKTLIYMLATIVFINMGQFIKFKNNIFQFLGKISMEIHLTHGLLEIVGQRIDTVNDNNFLYGSFVIVGTIAIGTILNKIFTKIFKGGNHENISSQSNIIHI